MLDLEVIQTDDVPKDAIEWLNKGYTLNTVFLSISGPNQLTGFYNGELVCAEAYKYDYLECPSYYAYYNKSKEYYLSRTLSGVPRQYRSGAKKVDFRVKTFATKNEISEFAVRQKLLSSTVITKIKGGLSSLFEGPTTTYKTTV